MRVSPLRSLECSFLASITTGAVAPDFTASSTGPNPLSLSSLLATGPVILAFYPKSFTGGWTVELQTFGELYSRFESAGIQIVGISTDNYETQVKFAESLNLTFELVADEDKVVSGAYGTLNKLRRGSTRQTFVIGQDGNILYHNAKVDPSDMQEYTALLDIFEADTDGL